MNPRRYIAAFAWISITALTCSLYSSLWLPMLVGAALIALLIRNGDLIENPNAITSQTHATFGQMGERRFAATA